MIHPAKGAHHHIFKDGHSCGDLHDLEGSANPFPIGHKWLQSSDVLPFEEHLPGIGLVVTDDAVEQGCLTGTIGADQADDFTLIDVERDMVIGHHSTKVLNEIDHLKKCHDVYLFFINPPSPP